MDGACSGLDGGDQKTTAWPPRPPFMVPRVVLSQTGSAGAGHGTVVTTPIVVSGHGLTVPRNDVIVVIVSCMSILLRQLDIKQAIYAHELVYCVHCLPPLRIMSI